MTADDIANPISEWKLRRCLRWLQDRVGLSEEQIKEARKWLSNYDAPGQKLTAKRAKKHITMTKEDKKSFKHQLSIVDKAAVSSSVVPPIPLKSPKFNMSLVGFD